MRKVEKRLANESKKPFDNRSKVFRMISIEEREAMVGSLSCWHTMNTVTLFQAKHCIV
jgi:hypothetical protein